jgi:hypothetical protein
LISIDGTALLQGYVSSYNRFRFRFVLSFFIYSKGTSLFSLCLYVCLLQGYVSLLPLPLCVSLQGYVSLLPLPLCVSLCALCISLSLSLSLSI